MTRTAATRSRALPAAGLALAALVVAGCGSANGTAKAGSTAPATTSRGAVGGFSFTAASGKATAVSGSGVKVATGSGTTVVAWATSTRFTRLSNGSRSSVAVGDCVTASSGRRSSTGSTAPSPSATTTVRATTVTVTGTTACTTRSGFAGRGSRGGLPSGVPTPRPTTRPTGAPGRAGRAGGFGGVGTGATGTVTSISGSTIVVKTQGFGGTGATTRRVTTTASTTYRVSSSATSAAVAKGLCVAAVGSKASDGTLDAQSITLSIPTGGACTAAGFAGGFGGGGFPGGGSGRPGGGAPPQGQSNA